VRESIETTAHGLHDWLGSIEREARAAGIDPDEKRWD